MRPTFSVRLATLSDRLQIYRIRYRIYAEELGQHEHNREMRLQDSLDAVNEYVVVRHADAVIGFVSITPPGKHGYSVEKYLSRAQLPVRFHDHLFEVRLLTVIKEWRNSTVFKLLILGAYKYLMFRKASEVIAIGKIDLMPIYEGLGFQRLGLKIRSGEVLFEVMTIDDQSFRSHTEKLVDRVDTIYLDGFLNDAGAREKGTYHGGAFFRAIGEDFKSFERINEIINADVLDAWFDPAPEVIEQIKKVLPWAIRTSPPTHCSGVLDELAATRGLAKENFVLGAGSSDLMFRAIRMWVKESSKVLILDPMYGEYAHILENVVGCDVRRFHLSYTDQYRLDLSSFRKAIEEDYDWIFLVNPNSPTGQFVNPQALAKLVTELRAHTRLWIDETYIDYIDPSFSLEPLACQSERLVICKSLSKIYALSGIRAAYLCGNQKTIQEVLQVSPPWILSLPAQIATVFALRNADYYRARWVETAQLRNDLQKKLSEIGLEVISGAANFLLCRISARTMTAWKLVVACRSRSLFLREVGSMGSRFDPYTFRISVKDRATNERMVEILKSVLPHCSNLD